MYWTWGLFVFTRIHQCREVWVWWMAPYQTIKYPMNKVQIILRGSKRPWPKVLSTWMRRYITVTVQGFVRQCCASYRLGDWTFGYTLTHTYSYQYILVRTFLFWYISVHTSTYKYVPFLYGINSFIMVHTWTFLVLTLHTGTYQYIPVHTSLIAGMGVQIFIQLTLHF